MIPPPVPRCSWCGEKDPKHEGYLQRRDGTEYFGNFCKEPCYEHWKLAHALIDGIQQ